MYFYSECDMKTGKIRYSENYSSYMDQHAAAFACAKEIQSQHGSLVMKENLERRQYELRDAKSGLIRYAVREHDYSKAVVTETQFGTIMAVLAPENNEYPGIQILRKTEDRLDVISWVEQCYEYGWVESSAEKLATRLVCRIYADDQSDDETMVIEFGRTE